MSPCDIEILLHYWCYPVPHPRADAPAVQESIQRFIDAGIFVRCDHAASGINGTEACRVLVEALCAVPFPVQRWVMP